MSAIVELINKIEDKVWRAEGLLSSDRRCSTNIWR